MWVLGSLVSLLEPHTPGHSLAPEKKPGSEGKMRPEEQAGACPHPDQQDRRCHLFLADLFIALVLKSLFHGGQRDLPVVLGDIIMEAANRKT